MRTRVLLVWHWWLWMRIRSYSCGKQLKWKRFGRATTFPFRLVRIIHFAACLWAYLCDLESCSCHSFSLVRVLRLFAMNLDLFVRQRKIKCKWPFHSNVRIRVFIWMDFGILFPLYVRAMNGWFHLSLHRTSPFSLSLSPSNVLQPTILKCLFLAFIFRCCAARGNLHVWAAKKTLCLPQNIWLIPIENFHACSILQCLCFRC